MHVPGVYFLSSYIGEKDPRTQVGHSAISTLTLEGNRRTLWKERKGWQGLQIHCWFRKEEGRRLGNVDGATATKTFLTLKYHVLLEEKSTLLPSWMLSQYSTSQLFSVISP